MSQQQAYLLHVLRRVESSTGHRFSRTARRSLESIIEQISQSADVQSTLETLYAVKGFDMFALRLMWCLERIGITTVANVAIPLDEEVDQISEALINTPNLSANGETSNKQPAHDEFYDRLHAVGRVVEELKRRLEQSDVLKTVDAEILYRVSSELESLRVSARNTGKQEIAACVASLLDFIHFAIENGIEHDPRLVNVLSHANLTIQTAEDAVTADGYASVLEMSALLKNPATILTR